MEMLALKLGPNAWFKEYSVTGEKDTTPVLGEAHLFVPAQLDRLKEMAAQEPYAQIVSMQVSEPTIIWDVEGDAASRGVSQMNLGSSQKTPKLRDELIKWASAHYGKLDILAFSLERKVSYHDLLQECQRMVDDGYLMPKEDSLACCVLTPKGGAAASALA